MTNKKLNSDPQPARAFYVTVPAASAVTAAASTGTVTTALMTGAVPADSPLVWPLVVLCVASMAYDVCKRHVGRR
ncbi:hypothetical protein ABTX82_27830 [Streptomyces lavendulae]|uniref:hypothetical protein n=1 Tax=Streptomyces lavendulae TaxID=1914 RepID=UPI00332D0D03